MKDIDILEPIIFPNEIISGVTKANFGLFPRTGLTLSGEQKEVPEHRKQFAEYINTQMKTIKFQKQVHGDTIRMVDIKSSSTVESDGMITKDKGLILSISIADCTAVLIYDSINQVICGIHSGWKGTSLNIVSKGFGILKEQFNSKPEDLLVYISPCASGRNYEVEWDVAKYFPETTKQISEMKYLFDNQQTIYNQLLELGVKERNIERSNICTIENRDFHSYRRDGLKSGRMSAFIGMKS